MLLEEVSLWFINSLIEIICWISSLLTRVKQKLGRGWGILFLILVLVLTPEFLIFCWLLLWIVPRREKVSDTIIAQLFPILKSGRSMPQCLMILAELHPVFRRKLLKAAQLLTNGASLTDVSKRHLPVLSPEARRVIVQGEASGNLVDCLGAYVTYIEQDRDFDSAGKSLLYPIFIFLNWAIISVTLIIFVVPTFSKMLADMGADLPWTTVVMISFTEALPGFLLLIALSVAVACWLHWRYGVLPWLSLPGSLRLTLLLSSFTDNFIRCGRTAGDAVNGAALIAGNNYLCRNAETFSARLANGEDLMGSIRATRQFPREFKLFLLSRLSSEGSAIISGALLKAMREQFNLDYIRHYRNMFLVLMLLVILLTAFLLLAIYLPIFNLAEYA